MARNPSPTKIHELRGSFDKNPQRRRKGEPEPKAGIGPPPDNLNEIERDLWDELVSIAVPGVLGDADRWVVEMTVRLMAEIRQGTESLPAAKITQLVSCLSRLGMTPSDRAKLSVPGKEDDGWNDI